MKKNNKKKPITLILIIILFAIILGLGLYCYGMVLNTELIYEGVMIDGLDISLLTKKQALNSIINIKETILDDKNMTLYGDGKEYKIKLIELGFYYDYSKAIDEAYSIGREGNIVSRLKEIIEVKKNGINISLDSKYDNKKIGNIVDKIAQEIDIEMKGAEFHFNNGRIQVTEEVVGKEVDKEKLKKLINDNIYNLKPIKIPINDLKPDNSKELLGRVNGIIGEFSTSFKGSSSERIENIRLSSKSLSKKLIMPGETVSFNETTGPRSKKAGYKEANIILKGEFVPSTGGGVCQTSTTLYNALLMANMTIIERTHHSIPIKYVDLGRDATVAYGVIDLKFRNDFDFPIYIHSKIFEDRIHIYIYGDKKSKDYTVKIESEVIEEIPAKEEIVVDDSLPLGTKKLVQEGRTGHKVNTYKSIIKNGKTISRDLITKDYYKPKNYIYSVSDDFSDSTLGIGD